MFRGGFGDSEGLGSKHISSLEQAEGFCLQSCKVTGVYKYTNYNQVPISQPEYHVKI